MVPPPGSDTARPGSVAGLPADFRRRICDLHGAAGHAWLAGLPALLAEAQTRWSLALQPPFALSYNFVAPATGPDGAVVLKAGVPGPPLHNEIAALRLYNGRGAARLLDADPAAGLMLLERLQPGVPLVEVRDDSAATAIAAEVMRQLWRPVPSEHGFPTVEDWAAGLGRLRARYAGGTGPLPMRLVDRAERLFSELLASATPQVVLHGDLHHWNILAAGRSPWLAIDPQGVVGEPAYEIGALLRNPFPEIITWPGSGRILARRIDQLAEMLHFDRARIVAWGYAQAVLSAWWNLEDHGTGWEPGLAVAELLGTI